MNIDLKLEERSTELRIKTSCDFACGIFALPGADTSERTTSNYTFQRPRFPEPQNPSPTMPQHQPFQKRSFLQKEKPVATASLSDGSWRALIGCNLTPTNFGANQFLCDINVRT